MLNLLPIRSHSNHFISDILNVYAAPEVCFDVFISLSLLMENNLFLHQMGPCKLFASQH
jgi:hypothetical protein